MIAVPAKLIPPLTVGTAVVSVVAIIAAVGGLDGYERQAIDYCYQSFPRAHAPMTSEIVFVDIDDGALDLVGRWPWKRTLLAGVIEELTQAGAKTIAIDLLLSEPSDEDQSDADASFADAIDPIATLLAVEVHDETAFDAAWRTEEGLRALERLTAELSQDVQKDTDSVIEAARLVDPHARLFAARPLQFKYYALWTVACRERESLKTFEDFERRFAPNLPELVDQYRERPLLGSVWRQLEAWRLAGGFVRPAPYDGTYRDRAPIPAFIASGDGVGFVNVDRQQDVDGIVREVELLLPAPGGEALQFGFAAAVLHRGVVPSELKITAEELRFGGMVIPLHDGKLWIHWPTSETTPAWEGFLRQKEDDAHSKGHLSIREIVRLSRGREIQALNRTKLAETTALILKYNEIAFQPGEELSAANFAAAKSDVDFTLEEVGDDTPTVEEDGKPFVDHWHNCKFWRSLDRGLGDDAARIAETSRTLSKEVAGKLVFIGWTATGALADFVTSPLETRTPGVVVHAAIANTVLTGSALRFPPHWLGVLVSLALGLLCVVLASRGSPLGSALLAVLVLGGYIGLAAWVFHDGGTLPLVAPITSGTSAWVVCTALQSAISQRDRRRIMRQFRRRVSRQLVDHLRENPEALTVSGEERRVTVLFCDIAGFTSLSESLGGKGTVSTLNNYLGELTRTLIDEDAYVNKFLGDGVMAFWSAFAVDEDQATKACRAGVRCQQALQALNESPEYRDRAALGLRIGIATGRVVVGDCGAPPDLNDYTVIGDTVNLSARLESANKQFGSKILIDGNTRAALDPEVTATRPFGRITVVGQNTPVEIHEVIPPEFPLDVITLTEQAVVAYQEQRFDDCMEKLELMAEKTKRRQLIDIYRRAIAEAGDDFDGVVHLTAK